MTDADDHDHEEEEEGREQRPCCPASACRGPHPPRTSARVGRSVPVGLLRHALDRPHGRPTHSSAPSANRWCFQIGIVALNSSMSSRQTSNASPRCSALTPTTHGDVARPRGARRGGRPRAGRRGRRAPAGRRARGPPRRPAGARSSRGRRPSCPGGRPCSSTCRAPGPSWSRTVPTNRQHAAGPGRGDAREHLVDRQGCLTDLGKGDRHARNRMPPTAEPACRRPCPSGTRLAREPTGVDPWLS